MAGPSSSEDFAFISELLETLEYDPSNIEIRQILAETYETYGWIDEAAEHVRQILALSPGDPGATAWLTAYLHGGFSTPERSRSPEQPSVLPAMKGKPVVIERSGGLKELETGYRSLMTEANTLLRELQTLSEMCPDLDMAAQMADLKGMTEGRFGAVVKAKPPPAARGVANKIKADKTNAVEIAFADLEANARWTRSQSGKEDVRETVRKRAEAIQAVLPKNLSQQVDLAFMHVEHEVLGKMYQNGNTSTMLGEPISAIPRGNFWVTEDGYAWDMSELADAIKANGGVMRNPLSRQMFTADDVKAIVRHPLGKQLAALQVRQQQMTKGVRPDTVTRLRTMATVLLADQSADSAASRAAVDEFVAYMATLPEAEQDALQNLRVPAKDSHTGQPFDATIGDAVADAKGNRQCFHKTGDLLQQAASYLQTCSPGSSRMPGGW